MSFDTKEVIKRFGNPSKEHLDKMDDIWGKYFFEDTDPDVPDKDLLVGVLEAFYLGETSGIALLIDRNRVQLDEACKTNELLRDVVRTCLECGVSRRSKECALTLGALFYAGQVVPQNYEAAKDLYMLAESWGDVQASINLGYIYEYGRTGQPDPVEAYRYYSFAAAVAQAPEALYKMGDIMSRGRAFGKDERAAFRLWIRCYAVADTNDDIENKAQAALRLAPFYLDGSKAQEVDVKVNALRALELYQTAEIGIRISIENGLLYYQKRLAEAIDGQERARAALDNLGTRE